MTDKKVSIIVRVKDEEKWIAACLKMIRKQTYGNHEVVIVDNCSTDKSLEKIKPFGAKVVTIKEFFPGKAINEGIRHSDGAIIVCLSGHCIPVNENWLGNLIRNLEDPEVAGVYGRQEPLSYSSDHDKRDLSIVFGLDRKVQRKDSFFHNANSAFRRETWEKYPFDEYLTNIEDRFWAKLVQSLGYTIVYEPSASVYHHHGIHHGGDPNRARNVVNLLESMVGKDEVQHMPLEELDVVAIIPVKGEPPSLNGRSLLETTIQAVRKSRHIGKCHVSTDCHVTAELGEALGADPSILRPTELSDDHIGLDEVIRFSLAKLEAMGELPDLVVILEVTYPCRGENLLDEMIENTVRNGLDTLVPVREERRAVWFDDEPDGFRNRNQPRHFKEHNAIVSLFGLGCVTHPACIRQGSLVGPKVGYLKIKDPLAYLEIRNSCRIDALSL